MAHCLIATPTVAFACADAFGERTEQTLRATDNPEPNPPEPGRPGHPGPDDAPPTPPDEPAPVPVQDPPAEPVTPPYVVAQWERAAATAPKANLPRRETRKQQS